MCGQDRWFESQWGVVAVSALLLLLGSLVPSPLRRHTCFGTFGPDKLLHLLGHAGFTTVLADALAVEDFRDRDAAVIAIVVSTSYGLLIGRLQTRVPGREPERADTVAGVFGSVLGVLGRRYFTVDSPEARH